MYPVREFASKHALRAMIEGLRMELAAQRSPVKVALISPGMVDTPWHAASRARDAVAKDSFRPLAPADIVQAVFHILNAPANAQVCDILVRPIGQEF